MRRSVAIGVVCGAILAASLAAAIAPKPNGRLKGAARRPAVNGWTYVHLEGSPAEIGFQHGYLLAQEIQDMQKVFALELTHDNGKDWNFFRNAAKNVLWPHVEQEYREELQGIAEGLNAQGVKLLEGGVRIDRSLYDRLVSHRLSVPLDECIAAASMIDGAALEKAARTSDMPLKIKLIEDNWAARDCQSDSYA